MSAAEQIIPRKIWTRAEVDLLPADVLQLELINGELIDRMGKNPPHIFWKNVLRNWLLKQFGDEFVLTGDPIDVSPQDNPINEPEPDLAVTLPSIKESRGHNPTPQEIRLVVEVADRTFHFDTTVKLDLYARAGIRECWVVDVRGADRPFVLIHKSPSEGVYNRVVRYAFDDEIVVSDGITLRLKDLT